MVRIGIGQDSHAFSKDTKKKFILGGLHVRGVKGLLATSDGDVLLHSLCNALSSAIGGDSLGTWADALCLKKGVTDSRVYARKILKKVWELGFVIGNVSFCVEAKYPRLPLTAIHEMKKNIAELLHIQPECVGITFTSGDGLTSFAKGKGLQAFCTVLIEKHD